jgi:hypothetical protein
MRAAAAVESLGLGQEFGLSLCSEHAVDLVHSAIVARIGCGTAETAAGAVEAR